MSAARSGRTGRAREKGVVLINVLAVMALASSVLFIMLTTQERAIDRSRSFSDAARAGAIAHGGVTSAIIALRRDAAASDRLDHSGESWGALAEETPIPGGSYSLRIRDLQGRFNINNLARGDVLAAQTFQRIVELLGIPPQTAARIAFRITEGGPIADLRELVAIGVGESEIGRLSTLVTALPGRTEVNANAAAEELLAILLGNPVRANVLVAIRDRQGYVSRDDLSRARVLLPNGLGLASDHFEVDATVRIGATVQRVVAHLHRRREGMEVVVVPLTYRRDAAAPRGAPP